MGPWGRLEGGARCLPGAAQPADAGAVSGPGEWLGPRRWCQIKFKKLERESRSTRRRAVTGWVVLSLWGGGCRRGGRLSA